MAVQMEKFNFSAEDIEIDQDGRVLIKNPDLANRISSLPRDGVLGEILLGCQIINGQCPKCGDPPNL